jgi:hypothetical protein
LRKKYGVVTAKIIYHGTLEFPFWRAIKRGSSVSEVVATISSTRLLTNADDSEIILVSIPK